MENDKVKAVRTCKLANFMPKPNRNFNFAWLRCVQYLGNGYAVKYPLAEKTLL